MRLICAHGSLTGVVSIVPFGLFIALITLLSMAEALLLIYIVHWMYRNAVDEVVEEFVKINSMIGE